MVVTENGCDDSVMVVMMVMMVMMVMVGVHQ